MAYVEVVLLVWVKNVVPGPLLTQKDILGLMEAPEVQMVAGEVITMEHNAGILTFICWR